MQIQPQFDKQMTKFQVFLTRLTADFSGLMLWSILIILAAVPFSYAIFHNFKFYQNYADDIFMWIAISLGVVFMVLHIVLHQWFTYLPKAPAKTQTSFLVKVLTDQVVAVSRTAILGDNQNPLIFKVPTPLLSEPLSNPVCLEYAINEFVGDGHHVKININIMLSLDSPFIWQEIYDYILRRGYTELYPYIQRRFYEQVEKNRSAIRLLLTEYACGPLKASDLLDKLIGLVEFTPADLQLSNVKSILLTYSQPTVTFASINRTIVYNR